MKTLQIAVPVPLRQYFDYLPLEGEQPVFLPGMRVRISFQTRELIGVLMGVATDAPPARGKLKPIIELIDNVPILDEDILKICLWAAEYYQSPVGEVLEHAMPKLLRQGRVVDLAAQPGVSSQRSRKTEAKLLTGPTLPREDKLPLNAAQHSALSAILLSPDKFQVFLLDGVTGSGKTEVYLQAITEFLNQDKQILILVPEIGLTPQTIARFRARFSVPIVALHSSLREKEKLNAWVTAKNGSAKIVIGTRSALFTPFKNLGLIIIDEEHDLSFKQQEGFRYHARDLAIMRAHFKNIPIVLGSATPSLETLQNALLSRYQHLLLPERAGLAQLPRFQILDIRKANLDEGLSTQLIATMKTHLEADNQVMLFLNRRGFAPVLMCHSCGFQFNCKRCDARMTYHQYPLHLHCHHCDSRRMIPPHCDNCKDKNLTPIGLGTERLEIALEKYFPLFSIARIDRDSTRKKGQMEKLLDEIQAGQHQILIGTQMLAKGHHFPNVTLVGIVDSDSGFFSSDFRALERMGQLVLQVSGRAGRVEKEGTVVIQTHHPEHLLLHQLIHHHYSAFAKTLLEEREQALLPPFSFFALFRAEAHELTRAKEFLSAVKNLFQQTQLEVQLLGPIPAPMAKRAGKHRVQLLLQAKNRPQLQHFLKMLMPQIEKMPEKKRVKWSLDVDPVEMF